MASIDERVVSMAFENDKFERNAAQTLKTLKNLNDSLKLTGAAKGLQDIQAASDKVTLANAGRAADGLKSKMDFSGAVKGLQDVQAASDKVTMGGAEKAADGLRGKFQSATETVKGALSSVAEKLKFPGADKAFSFIQSAASRVSFAGLGRALDSIKTKLGFPEAPAAFAAIENSSKSVHLTGITNAISHVKNQFSVLQGAAAVALGNIAASVARSAASTAKSLTLGPVIDGLHEYETQLNAVQTILANTQASGATLQDVNKALNQLNKYADKTIYNFSEMTRNIGTFTAAGVDLNTATESIKGIANLAAVSGSNAQQASTAMYQLSQAISAGRVSLQDWNSVVNAGMGGTVFQRALAQTAVKMGTLKDNSLKLVGPMKNVAIDGESFRQSIQAGPGKQSWLTSKVLTNTLKQFSGDLTDAQLKAQGFSDAQIKAIQAQAKTALNAATQVKTFSAFMDTTKEAIGSGWAQTWQQIFGDFGEAKTFWTGVSNAVNGMISTWSNARNKVLKDWKELGGRKELIKALGQAWKDLTAILRPIKEAFRDIFPAKTGKDLFNMTVGFKNLMDRLELSPETAKNLKDTFKGLFAILDIGWQIIKGVGIALGQMLGAAGDSSGGILKITGSIGDFLAGLDQAIKKSSAFRDFFVGIGKVLSIPIHLFGKLAGLIAGLFGGVSASSADSLSKSLSGVGETLSPLSQLVATLTKAWDGFLNAMDSVRNAVAQFFPHLTAAFGDVIDKIKSIFSGASWDDVFSGLQTGLIAGIFLTIRKALSGGIKFDPTRGVLNKVKDMLDAMTGSLKQMQQAIKAAAILEIATAIGVLAAGVKLLSTIDPKRLASAMTSVAVGLGQLVGAMALLTKMKASVVQMPFIAAGLIGLAVAVDTLAIAVKAFSTMSWEDLIKGLAGVGGVLVAVGAGVKLIPTAQMVVAGPALIALSIGINALALATKIFSTMKWGNLAKGILGVAGALTAVAFGVTAMPMAQLAAAGPSLILVSTGLILLSGAVRSFGGMKVTEIGKGLLGVAGSLVVLGVAMNALPPPEVLVLQAVALNLTSAALIGIATAIGVMGNLKVGTMVKGLIGIGGALAVLAVGLDAMAGTLPGAAALVAAAAGLDLLAPALGMMGSMKWSTIIRGLVAIGASIGVIAVVGTVAAPGLIAIGVGLLGLGVGLAAIGASVYLTAKGLSLLAEGGQKGMTALLAALTAFIAVLPTIVINFVKGLVGIVDAVAAVAPKVAVALGKIANSLLDALIQISPKIAIAMGSLIDAMILAIGTKGPDLVAAGFNLLLGFLKGVDDHIGEVVPRVGHIISTFLTKVSDELPNILASGARVLLKFLGGIASKLPEVVTSVAAVITKFLGSVASHAADISASGVNVILKFLGGIISKIPDVIKGGVTIILKVLQGIGDNVGKIERKAVWVIGTFLDAMADAVISLSNKIATTVVRIINGIDQAIRDHQPEIWQAGFNLAWDLVLGFVKGISNLPSMAWHKIKGGLGDFVHNVKKHFDSHSPSRVMERIGQDVTDGFVKGVGSGYVPLQKHAKKIANTVIWTVKEEIKKADPFANLFESGTLTPKITPVVDSSGVKQLDDAMAKLQWFKDLKAAGGIVSDQTIAGWQAIVNALQNDPNSPLYPGNQAGGGGMLAGVNYNISYVQNNTSPKALTPAEVYRQTNNQLSSVKSALGLGPLPGTLAGVGA